jgi:hypothetical protein
MASRTWCRNCSTRYDVSADGTRFAMIRTTAEDVAARQVNLIVGWADELVRQGGEQR